MQLSHHQEIQILHVDDDPSITDLTGTFLERDDDRFAVETATSADEGLRRISDRLPDCVVSDYDMPGLDGLEFLQTVREEYPNLPFILFTGRGSETVASDAIAAGVTDYLQKGTGTEQYELLANRIRNAVQAKRDAQRVKRQEQLMRLTEFAGGTGGFELDVNSGDLLLTEGTRRLIGLPEDAHLSLEEAIELYHPDDQANVRQTVDRAAETGEQTRDTWRLQTLDGDERLVDVTITPATEGNDVTTLRGAVHDVTERKKRRRELEQVETWFQYAQTGLVLLDVGEEFTVERVNPMWEETTGLSADQVRGRTLQDVLGEQAGAIAEQKTRECVQQQEPVQFEESVQFDGEQTIWETRIAPVTVDETVEYIVGETREVTARRERQQELQRLQQAIDGANVPITLADPSKEDDPLVYVNDAFEDVTGYPPEEALGRNCRFLQGEHTDPEKVTALRNAIDDEEPISLELRNYRKDGTEFWNRLTITPIYDDSGDLVRYLGTQEDITERKERERELRAERQFIKQALDALDDLFYVLDTDGTLRRWNDRVPETTGYADGELADMDAIELFPEDDRETIAGAIETTQADREATVEADLRTADGDRLPHEFTGAQLTDEDGTVTGLVGVGRDLTDRRQRERRFQAFVEESRDIISVVDVDGVFQYQSPAVEHILGYQPDEMVGDAVWEYIHPDDHERLKKTFDEWVTAPGTSGPVEYRVRHADGSWRWMEANGSNRLDSPAVEGYVVNSRDITDRKERERELDRTRDLISSMEQLADVGGWEYESETETLRITDGTRRLYGLDPDAELTLEEAFEAVHPDDREQLTDRFSACLKTGKSYEIDVRLGTQNGECQWVTARGERVDDTASSKLLRGYLQDITEQKEYKRELEAQNERLSEFTGIVSHDLRNPLNIAESRIELAQTECESSHLKQASDALNRGQALIDDLLILAREGERASDFEPVELADIVDRCWESVETKQATLEIEQTQAIKADEGRLRQVLENLYRNAIEHGGNDVTMAVGSMDDGFYVADTGPGISESDRGEVFEAGYSTSEDGTGFGLRIVEQIADAHGWEVTVTESEQGGAQFNFTGVEIVE